MIEAEHLIFEYPGVRALDDVGFCVRSGEIAALVGPNGAGKTTLLRCLAALDRPLAGSMRVAEVDVLARPRACHRRVGYLADFYGLYEELTVRQCLTYVARAHGIVGDALHAGVTQTAARLGIADRTEQKVRTLSRGLRQRVAIAQALVHGPEVLLLDEPASGLDPEARHSLAQLFVQLQREGMTLLVSSHILAELQEYATTMLILRRGRIVEYETVEPSAGESATVRLILSAPFASLSMLLAEIDDVTQVSIEPDGARFRCRGDPVAQHELLKTLIERGVPVSSFAQEKVNLQDTYLSQLRRPGAVDAP